MTHSSSRGTHRRIAHLRTDPRWTAVTRRGSAPVPPPPLPPAPAWTSRVREDSYSPNNRAGPGEASPVFTRRRCTKGLRSGEKRTEEKREKSEVLTSAAEATVYLSDADIELLLSDNKVAALRNSPDPLSLPTMQRQKKGISRKREMSQVFPPASASDRYGYRGRVINEPAEGIRLYYILDECSFGTACSFSRSLVLFSISSDSPSSPPQAMLLQLL
ncbi:hypothetical protein EYF80_040728 [Liparis tanakae]|uniref:Uncharacterized protein n=1 Tax=Liparis tanakae TaxID=230148 RepID=A0A4Z2G745_9TELE|nr:hypothetical protein EYF80_040728 [Liparis tanakae]